MTKDNIVLPYKLEQHLTEICKENPTYINLLSVWNINKKMCQDALSTVVINYPHYTRHDVSHCEAIITNIEMLLGEEAIRLLSPTDTWLLLHAAYLHDIGMVIECKRIEDNWESKEFQDYLHAAENSLDDSLAENAKLINSFGEKRDKGKSVLAWPVRVRYAVTLLIADYYRKEHAVDSRSYLEDMGNAFHIDLGYNGLIQQRLINVLADVAYLHTESNDKLLELDYRTNGFNADYAHPRFLAQMLRMGDLLDADNNRFNASNEIVFGEIPESSRNHWEKHMSARHILITPDIIEYRADCSKPEVYRETRNFLSWLKTEVEFWALNWKNIMPENIKGSAPKLGKCELLLDGVPDIQGLSDLQFSISTEKAFEVIEGANIYEDKFVFLREVIQNALDACKIQMWRDISENRYRSWIAKESVNNLQPFQIKNDVFENYGVDVILRKYDENHFKVIISDNGIGISAEQFKKICNVGVSYSGDKKRSEEVENMPLWLRPTAGFGIGLQSIFLIADEFEIYSKAAGNDGIYAKVTSRRKNGYVQISKSDVRNEQGTEIHVVLPSDMTFSYGFSGNTAEFISEQFDPFSGEKQMLYYMKIWDVLCGTIENTLFPIKLFFEDKQMAIIKSQKFDKLEKCSDDGRYYYNMGDDYQMSIWDCKTNSSMSIYLRERYERYNNQLYFKGMQLKNAPYMVSKGIWYAMDLYGLDTKKTLTLDRKNLRKGQMKIVDEILDDAVQFYFSIIKEAVFSSKTEKSDKECGQIYTFWCIASLEDKMDLLSRYSDIFSLINVSVEVMKKAGNSFQHTEIDYKDIIHNLDKTAVVDNIDDYTDHNGMQEKLEIENIIDLLNTHANDIPFEIVIIDKAFREVLIKSMEDRIMLIPNDSSNNKFMYLISYRINTDELPTDVGQSTKRYLLEALLKSDDGYHYHDGTLRGCIPALKGYDTISTSMIPFGIRIEYFGKKGNVISPVTTAQWQKYKHLDKKEFVNAIVSSIEFDNLIKHVSDNPINEKSYTQEQIRAGYIDFIGELYDVGSDVEI